MITEPRAASREALVAVRERSDAVSQESADTLLTIARELHSVADLLVDQPRLRRALADGSTDPDGRASLLGRLLTGRISQPALDIAQTAVRQRWSSPWDLTDGLTLAGDDAVFAAAERARTLDEVEDELFRFGRVLAGQSDLAALLDDQSVPAERRVGLLRSIIDGKVQRTTQELLEHAVASARSRSIEIVIDHLLGEASRLRSRSVALVLTAVPLTDQQESRLANALTSIYGRQISVRTALDPSVRGGLLIRVGDEVIDGSVATRFAQARAALAG
jgi:F-type H+-transporting ATPase subunit delta